MRIFTLILVLLLTSACSDDPYVLVSECPEENHKKLQAFVDSCTPTGNTPRYCSHEAKKLFCEQKYIRNPNVKLKKKEY
jgi:hypothetical protein